MRYILLIFLLLFPLRVQSLSEEKKISNRFQSAKNPMGIKTDNRDLEKGIQNQFRNESDLTKEKLTKFLLKEGYFKSRIEKTPEGFSITNPFKMIFILTGNHFLKNYKIKKLIKETPKGHGFEDNLIDSLKSAYQAKGFQKITITTKKVVKGWKEWVYLAFHEGPRVKIAEIQLSGLISRSPDFYVDFIKSNSSSLIKQGYFNKKDLEIGYKNLVLFLKKNGYLGSRIYSDRITYKDNKVYVTVNLDEGPLTLIRSITFSGNQAFSHPHLSALMNTKIFEPLRLKILEEDLLTLEEFYKNQGYLQMKVLNKKDIISQSEKSSYASIHITIKEGPQSHISEILVEGTVRAKQDFIRKLLKFKTGEVLSLKKIRDSRSSLNALGIFSRMSIDWTDDADSIVTVSLTEKNPRLIRSGMGMNTERGLTARAYTDFTHRNLFGWGQSLFGKAGGQVNLLEKTPVFEYELSGVYQELLFPEQNIKGSLGLSRTRSLFNYTEKDINGVRKHNIRFLTEKKIPPSIRLNWSVWDFETRQQFCIYKAHCPKKFQSIGSSRITLIYDKRNNIFNPSKGLWWSLMGEYGSSLLGSSSNIQFSKISQQFRFYVPITRQYTMASELSAGALFSTKSIPVSRAFILGGQTTIRGYDGHIEGERIPNKKDVPIETANESLKLKETHTVTSSYYGLFKLETRFPLFKSFKTVIFYDAGAVYLKSRKRSLFDLGHSVGIGFLYETFLIPVGLEFAYKLPPRPTGAGHFRFHFAIGLF